MADKVKLPTEEDIRQLPRWARVAFAARCARRVLPQFKKHGLPDGPKRHIAALAQAIEIAEQSAAAAALAADAADVVAAYAFAASAADAADAARTASADAFATAIGFYFASAAASAAANAANAANTAKSAGSACAACAARAATHAATAAGVAGTPTIVKDFQTVLGRAKAGKWADDTPVPPEVFGPLWPDGPPPGWPTEEAPADGS